MAHFRSESVRCIGTFTTRAGVLQDPDTITLTIYDSEGTLLATKTKTDLTNESTGVYYYDYTVVSDDPLGTYMYKYVGTKDSIPSIEAAYFTVVEYETTDYCNVLDVYRKAGVSTTVISNADTVEHILDAQGEVDEIFGRSFKSNTTFTEWIDTYNEDETETIEGPEINEIFLENRPIQSITSMESYDVDENLQETWTATDYWLDTEIGRIRLRSETFGNQRRRLKVVYKQGYASVPRRVKDLTSCIAGIQILVQQIGGTYDDVTSYSLPTGISVSVGEPYMNMKATIERLDKRIQSLTKTIGRYKNNSIVI